MRIYDTRSRRSNSKATKCKCTSIVNGYHQYPTVLFINADPNPIGVGQTATIDFWIYSPMPNSGDYINMTLYVTTPGSTTPTTLGNFTSSPTGSTYTLYIPTVAGNYTFQWDYGGQYIGAPYNDYMEPGTSPTTTLVVGTTPVGVAVFEPLPTQFWETPVNSQNVQNWASLTGPWQGLLAHFLAKLEYSTIQATITHTLQLRSPDTFSIQRSTVQEALLVDHLAAANNTVATGIPDNTTLNISQ